MFDSENIDTYIRYINNCYYGYLFTDSTGFVKSTIIKDGHYPYSNKVPKMHTSGLFDTDYHNVESGNISTFIRHLTAKVAYIIVMLIDVY